MHVLSEQRQQELLTLCDEFITTYQFIPFKFLEEILTPEEYTNLGKFFFGQTGIISESFGPCIYSWDFKRWLKLKN